MAPATHFEEDLRDLLPLVEGKDVCVVVTFIDRVDIARRDVLGSIEHETGLPFVYLDARRLSRNDESACHAVLGRPAQYIASLRLSPIRDFGLPSKRSKPKVPSPTKQMTRAVSALLSLLLPGVSVVWLANSVAEVLDPLVRHILSPLVMRFPYPVLRGGTMAC